jgi:hypothetical protein
MKISDKKIDSAENVLIIIFIVLSLWCASLTWGFLFLENELMLIKSTQEKREILQDTTIYHLKLIEVEYGEELQRAEN